MGREEFINLIAPLVVQVCEERGYGNAQVWTCICQACLESNYGNATIMRNANAFFGIKATASWVKKAKYGGLVYSAKTSECYDGKTHTNITGTFRAYYSMLDSIRDYFDLMEIARYKASLTMNTVSECITHIITSGYATSTTYITSISNMYSIFKDLIESYKVEGEGKRYNGKRIVDVATTFLGSVKGDNNHKYIIDTYNRQAILPRNVKMTYVAPWCATFVSAISLMCGYTSIIPTECSCGEMIKKLKALGEWEERDDVTPQIGWLIFYDWKDTGKGDDTTGHDHVGIVEKVVGNKITVIEGNYSNSVKRRTIDVNGRYIRGFGVPKYDEVSGIPVEVQTPEKTIKIDSAKGQASALVGTYKTTTSINLRSGASPTKTKIALLPKGTECKCYGYYNTTLGVKWYLVQTPYGTGYAMSTYLKK